MLTAALAACGGGGDEAAPATESVPVTAPDSVETTGVPTTSASTTTTTSPPTAEPTTTRAPTTTIDPAEALAAEVEADFLEAERLRIDALMTPTDPSTRDMAVTRRLGLNRQLLEDTLDELESNGLAIRENSQVTAEQVIERVFVVPGADTAELVRCEVDPWLVVEVGAAPDGTDAIVNDDVLVYRNRVRLLHEDGLWKISEGVQLDVWVGVTECPDS